MKKIIAAFDGLKFSDSTLKYAIAIATATKAHLIGVFLDDMFYHSYTFRQVASSKSVALDSALKKWSKTDQEKRDASVRHFEKECQAVGIPFSVHRKKDIAIHELLHESIYADLLIIGANETFNHLKQDPPSRFLKELLAELPCPALVVPAVFQPIESLVLLYDGKPSSVYAVKMFSYILPQLKDLPTKVVSVKEEEESLHLPDNKLMKEFMKRHFPKAKYEILQGSPENNILSALEVRKDHPLIVLGAYQRSSFSRWFRMSMADHMISYIKEPVFIAHNK